MNYALIGYAVIGVLTALFAYFAYKGKRRSAKHLELGIPPMFHSKQEVEGVGKRPKQELSPIAGTCIHCNTKTTLPFKCKFCKNLFCSEHRLPENHNCSGI